MVESGTSSLHWAWDLWFSMHCSWATDLPLLPWDTTRSSRVQVRASLGDPGTALLCAQEFSHSLSCTCVESGKTADICASDTVTASHFKGLSIVRELLWRYNVRSQIRAKQELSSTGKELSHSKDWVSWGRAGVWTPVCLSSDRWTSC